MNIVINFAREIGTLMFISRVIPNLPFILSAYFERL